MAGYFESHEVDSPRLSAELLLSHIIGCERLRLYMENDRPASPLELVRLRELVKRAGQHEPIAYLLGDQWFFGLRFKVTPGTLIPRPSTETIVEHVLQHHRATSGFEHPSILDLGTGCGTLAVSLAVHIDDARIIATDVSESALETARHNATHHKVSDRIEFLHGSWFGPIEEHVVSGRADYLVCNPPYISDAEWEEVEPNVTEYEPVSALRGGVDGLDDLRVILDEAPRHVRPGGQIALEIAASQGRVMLEMAQAHALIGEAHVLNDHEGLPRVLVGERVE